MTYAEALKNIIVKNSGDEGSLIAIRNFKITLSKEYGFYFRIFGSMIYDAELTIYKNGYVYARIGTLNLIDFHSPSEFFEGWNIIERRVLIEKAGYSF